MFPWKSVIKIIQPCHNPVYVQIANSIIGEIKQGRVQPGAKLPGSRALASLLEVHRKTVVAAYDELDAQGWIELKPSRGAFVNGTLPVRRPVGFNDNISGKNGLPEKTGFPVEIYTNASSPIYAPKKMLGLHDGPDLRLVPTALISRTYKGVLTRKNSIPYLRYNDAKGSAYLRLVLSDYLNESRGLQTTADNIFITRGSQQGMFFSAMTLLKPGDNVLTGDPGYYYAERTFTNFGAHIVRVPTDENGICTEYIEDICRRKKIRMVYVTPHHNYPTTVVLSAARRMELLSLSEKYGFAILEDDYDYDFHYKSSPLLPLASADQNRMVIYIGSLSKTFAPALRVGFLVAPKNMISEIEKRRQLVDVQGDWILEQTYAELFKLGEIQRHMKKALKIYRDRLGCFCHLMETELGDIVQFEKPEGGMAIWSIFNEKYPVWEVAQAVKKKGVLMPSNRIINGASEKKWNAARLGFAAVNKKEAEKAVGIIREVCDNMGHV